MLRIKTQFSCINFQRNFCFSPFYYFSIFFDFSLFTADILNFLVRCSQHYQGTEEQPLTLPHSSN